MGGRLFPHPASRGCKGKDFSGRLLMQKAARVLTMHYSLTSSFTEGIVALALFIIIQSSKALETTLQQRGFVM